MTQTRKGSNGHAKATSKRVGSSRVYNEFEAPDVSVVNITEKTQATVSIWRLVAIIASVAFSAASVAWYVSGEVNTLKRDVQSLASSVTDFKESIKELNGNLKYLSSGTWSRGDMQAFCRNFEAINAGAKIKCPSVDLHTGAVK